MPDFDMGIDVECPFHEDCCQECFNRSHGLLGEDCCNHEEKKWRRKRSDN